jgi:hypothetical protein
MVEAGLEDRTNAACRCWAMRAGAKANADEVESVAAALRVMRIAVVRVILRVKERVEG